MRIVFMGTPEIALPSLQVLIKAPDLEVSLVVSQPNRPVGRGKKMRQTPVAKLATQNNIPVFQPDSLKTESAYERLLQESADLFIVVAYGQILQQRILDLPRIDCINVHTSLLPRWRGAAPIQWAIRAGDAVSGVSIMRMERSLDTGPVFAMSTVMIGDTETASELHDRLAQKGASTLLQTLPDIIAKKTPVPQFHTRMSYARMLTKADRTIPFGKNAKNVADHINGMTSWPGAVAKYTKNKKNISLTFTRARPTQLEKSAFVYAPGEIVVSSPQNGLIIACGNNTYVEILNIKRPGKRSLSTSDCLRGFHIPVNTHLL